MQPIQGVPGTKQFFLIIASIALKLFMAFEAVDEKMPRYQQKLRDIQINIYNHKSQ
jgi:hypothetical protein